MTNTMKKLTVLLVGMLFVLCTAMALAVGMPASTAFAASTTSYSIGDTVGFVGYEWYIIGTETEGVTAPSGCYTLFAKNDEFGISTFDNINYKDSSLCQSIGAISGDFSSPYLANIVPRDTFDGISGASPTNQYLWALSRDEAQSLDVSLRSFATDYWTRSAGYDSIGPDLWENVAWFFNAAGTTLLYSKLYQSGSCAIRPALYVKASFLKEPNTEPTTEVKEVAFGGEYWYVVGEGSTGSVWGPENTVTLFQNPSTEILAKTDLNYLGSELQQAMANFATTLGLSDKEISLIVPRTLTAADGISGETAANQPFWALSKDEATAIGNTEILKSSVYNVGPYYWLRTIYEKEDAYSYIVKGATGEIIGSKWYVSTFDWNYGVRPAFYLDVSDVFYIAQDGKHHYIADQPESLRHPDERYAYTMFDNNLYLTVNATPTQTTQTGSSLSFGYTASTGENLRLACVFTDGDGNVLYYNYLVDLSDSTAYTGMVNIPIGSIKNGNYTLSLYTEQHNEHSIDYASQPVDLQITVENGVTSIVDLGDVTAAPAITGVTVTPTNPSVESGGQQQLSAIVTSAGGWCDQTVNWTVTGARSSGTSISSAGLLTVAEDETATSFTVTATSVQDVSVSSSVTVTVAFTNPKIMLSFNNSVYSYMEMIDAINAISGFETTAEKRAVLKLLDNFDLTSALTFNTGFITLDLNGYMLKQTGSGSVISINEGADFILDDLSGTTATHNYYVAEDGLWTFYDGDLPEAAPDGAVTGVVTGGVITGGNGSYGGGVYVNGGTFTMESCTISGNTATNGSGGGVYVNGGTFTMNGGTISGNSATRSGGGVFAEAAGTFTMNDGMIAGNTASQNGGGVGVAWSGTFTMTDGMIAGNTATYGGGVYVSGRTFTMEGGAISGNTASKDGGGVYVEGGTFTMKDGAITNNIASNNNNKRGGGGVFVAGTFTMEGGTISGNATNGSGGGVNVFNSSDSMFNMTGGYLGDNTATESENNIFKDGDGKVSISGGYFAEEFDTAYLAENCVLQDVSALGGATFDGDYKDGFPYAVYAQGGILISTNKDIVYDGSPVAEGVDFTVEGTDGVEFTYLYMTAGDESISGLPTNAGDYTLSAYALNEEKQFISVLFDITIAKATYDMSGITFEDGSFTYDGQAHSLAIAGNLPYGVSVNYINNAQVNAGEYTVTAKFTGDYTNYNTIDDMTAKLTIAKADYDMSGITFADDSVPYNGEEQSLIVSGTLPAGVTVTYEGNGKVNAGEYTVTASFAGDYDNYNAIADMTATLTIAKADYDMSDITFEDGSFTYDGQAHSLVISGTLPTGVSVTYAGNDKTNSGEYTVTATFVGDYDNYIAIPDITATLTIAKAAPAYTAPTDLTVVAEGTLADIALPDGWAWKDGTVRLTETGEYKAVAVYTAADTANYNPVEVELTITVLEPEGLSGGAIAGIVIGSVFGALILAYAICALLYKKKILKGAFFAKIYPFIKD